jgi:hypothetical protein
MKPLGKFFRKLQKMLTEKSKSEASIGFISNEMINKKLRAQRKRLVACF